MNSFLLFLNISGGEILVIIVVVYLVFGPKKIPELARMLGKGINELRRATNDIKREINKEMSGVKKEMNMDDIDLKDPLNINKEMNGIKKEMNIDDLDLEYPANSHKETASTKSNQSESKDTKVSPEKENPEEKYI